MKLISTLFVLLLCASCASVGPISEKSAIKKKKITPAERIEKLLAQITFQEISIPQGQTKFVRFLLPKSLMIDEVNCDQVGKLNFLQEQNNLKFFIPVPYTFEIKKFNCTLKVDKSKKESLFLSVMVLPVEYPTKMLNVSKKHVELSEKDVKRWLKEKKLQDEIYGSPHAVLQFSDSFINPLKSKITSYYGYKRVFNNKKDSWHSGTDFRAPIGTKIPATNRGIVRYAGELFFNGGTVILDHGMGIFTMYCHLSKLLVSEGEVVPKGQIIALSGNTGRSTGPHLHWGAKVNGHWVDSKSLILESAKLFHPVSIE